MKIALIAIVAIAALARVVLVSHATWVPVSDSRDYHDFARSLANGDGYVQVYHGETVAFRDLTLRAYRMPGYSAFLALVYSLGGWRPLAAYFGNVVCDVVTILAVAGIACAVFTPATAVAATVLMSTAVVYTASLTSEALFTALLTALAWMSATRLRAPAMPWATRVRWALAFGMVLAAAVFVRPIGIVALPVALLAVWRTQRADAPGSGTAHVPSTATKRTSRLAGVAVRLRLLGPSRAPRLESSGRALLSVLLIAPVAIGIAGWTVRNARVLDAFVPLSTNFGAHNAASFGLDFERTAIAVRERGGGEVEIDQVLRTAIAERRRRDPGAAFRVYRDRVVGLLQLRPDWITRRVLLQQTFARTQVPPWIRRAYAGAHALQPKIYGIALLGGIVLALERRRVGGLWWLAGSFIAVHAAVSRSDERFAAPLYPFFALAAAYVVVWLPTRARTIVRRVQARRRSRIG